MTYDYSIIGNWTTNINFMGLGAELLIIGLCITVAIMFTNKKRDFAIAFIFLYTITFLLGWGQNIGLLVLLGLVAGWYRIRTRDLPNS